MTAMRELAVAEREAPGSHSGSKRTYRELPRLSRRYQWRGVDPAYVQAGAVFWGRIRPGERGYVLVSSTGRAALASGTSRDGRDAPAARGTVVSTCHMPRTRPTCANISATCCPSGSMWSACGSRARPSPASSAWPRRTSSCSGFAVGSNHPLSDGVVCRSAPEQRRHWSSQLRSLWATRLHPGVSAIFPKLCDQGGPITGF